MSGPGLKRKRADDALPYTESVKPLPLLFSLAPGLLAGTLFSPNDLQLLRRARDPRIRADAQRIVYVESWTDPSAAVFSNLWLASSDGKERHLWTEGRWRDWSPRWSPDGLRIAWLRTRGGATRIRVRALDSGPDAQLESAGETPLALAWSTAGDAIAYTALLPAAGPPAWAPPELVSHLKPSAPETAVFVAPVHGGRPRRLSGDVRGCGGEPAWLLDGKSIAAACDAGIYLFPAAPGAAARLLTPDSGRYESPVVSPDGGRIAYLFRQRLAQSYTVRKLCVMRTDGTRGKILSGMLDRDARLPQWSSESRTVYFVADDRGATHVYAAHNDGTVRQATTAAERLHGFTLADNGRAVSVRSTESAAGDVVTFTVDVGTAAVTIASPNRELLAARDLGAVEPLAYRSSGHEIQAWLVKPPAFDPARRYPLMVDVADAPRRMYGVEFQARAQVFAAAGFVVLCANPRGTPGYGEEFGNLLRSRYPGDDFDDLMSGVDAAIAKGFIDPDRLHIAGGLLAAWAIGHTTRFRSAIARRPIADWTTDVALAPSGARRAAELMGAMPWDDPEQYWKHSPIYFAANFQTPTLVLAGERDAEAEELYFALRQRKVDCALVRIGSDRVLELRAILAWLANH